jgi:hypothetical protein
VERSWEYIEIGTQAAQLPFPGLHKSKFLCSAEYVGEYPCLSLEMAGWSGVEAGPGVEYERTVIT